MEISKFPCFIEMYHDFGLRSNVTDPRIDSEIFSSFCCNLV